MTSRQDVQEEEKEEERKERRHHKMIIIIAINSKNTLDEPLQPFPLLSPSSHCFSFHQRERERKRVIYTSFFFRHISFMKFPLLSFPLSFFLHIFVLFFFLDENFIQFKINRFSKVCFFQNKFFCWWEKNLWQKKFFLWEKNVVHFSFDCILIIMIIIIFIHQFNLVDFYYYWFNYYFFH